jgi:hypothetical protein
MRHSPVSMAQTFDGWASIKMLADMHRLLTPVTAMSTGTAPGAGGCGASVLKSKSWSCGGRARHGSCRKYGSCGDGGRSRAPLGCHATMAKAMVIVHTAIAGLLRAWG